EGCRFLVMPQLRAAARDAIWQGRYGEASGIVQQILALDESDDYARGVQPLLQEWDILDQYRFPERVNEWDAPDERHARERVARWEALRLPYDDVLCGVFDWPDFAAVHREDIVAAFGESPYSRAQTEAQLTRKLPELTFSGDKPHRCHR